MTPLDDCDAHDDEEQHGKLLANGRPRSGGIVVPRRTVSLPLVPAPDALDGDYEPLLDDEPARETPSPYPWSGRLSFSLLKTIAISPAHFLRACTAKRTSSTTMRRGTMAHLHLFGVHPDRPAPLFYRDDKVADPLAWRAFQADAKAKYGPDVEIFSAKEDIEGKAIADAVKTAPHNRALWEQWIEGAEYEVPLEWDFCGFPFRTRGVDIVHHARRAIVDYKTARSTEPRKLAYAIRDYRYVEQLATYDDGMRAAYQNESTGEVGFDAQEWAIFATDTVDPYVSTVVRIGRDQIVEARRTIFAWADLLHSCLAKNDWPGYEREPIDLDGGTIDMGEPDGFEE